MFNNRLFNISNYKKLSDVNRARVGYSAIIIFGTLFTIYALFIPFSTLLDNYRLTYLQRALNLQLPLFTLSFFAFYTIMIASFLGIRRGLLNKIWVALGPAAMIYVGGVWIGAINNFAYAENAYLIIPVILLAGLLDGERGFLIFMPITLLTLVVGYSTFIGQDSTNNATGLLLLLMVMVGIMALLYSSLRNTQIGRLETETESSRRRLQLAQLTTQITRSISEIDNLDTVLNELVEQVSDNFTNAYHTQIFLNDSTGRTANLIASTGEIGQKLLAKQHSLPIGSLSVIGQVTQRNEAIIAEVGGDQSIHRPNELLPETRLEIAIPLNIGDRNIGALDIQSKSPTRFTEEELAALQSIANSIAITIDNTRLIARSKENLKENQRLVEQMEVMQAEVQRLNHELTGTIWANYMRNNADHLNIDIDYANGEIIPAKNLTSALTNAMSQDDIIRINDEGQKVIAIPIRVRGEVIGAMEFEIDNELTSEDMDMLREVGERFGLAAENNRLYQTSQRSAQREALVNEISTRIQSANSVEATLIEATRSLRDALKAKRVAIHLNSNNPLQNENQEI